MRRNLVICLILLPIFTNEKAIKYEDTQDLSFALNFLVKSGYLTKPHSNAMTSEKELTEALRTFQKFAGLKVTGRMDDDTLTKMNQPRCGVPDIIPSKRHKRFVIIDRWPKTDITYRFHQTSKDMSTMVQKSAIREAFSVWSNNTPLSFKEGSSGAEDISISFQQGYHNDGYPFDGTGHTLAHAFFPGQGSRSGDVHFDEDETWTANDGNGTDLFMVATHEIGHALGLGHSAKLNSIMLPFYQGRKRQIELSYDDRSAINELYGNLKADLRSEFFPPTAAPRFKNNDWWNEGLTQGGGVTDPDICSTDFDAVAHLRGEIFFIKGKSFWRILHSGRLYSKTSLMSKFWTNFPDVKVDAAYQRLSGKMVFFSGHNYYEYSDNCCLDENSPRPITEYGLPEDITLDAALVWPPNERAYFFSGEQFWRYDEQLGKMEEGYPKLIRDKLNGVPSNLDAALTNPFDNKTYFIKGNQCWQYDNKLFSVSPGYPKTVGRQWFGCGKDTSLATTTSYDKNTHSKGLTTTSSGNGLVPSVHFLVFFVLELFAL